MGRKGSVVWWNAMDVKADQGALKAALAAVDAELAARVPDLKGAHGALRRAAGRRQGSLEDNWRWIELGVQGTALVFGLVEGTATASTKWYASEVLLCVSADSATGFLSKDTQRVDGQALTRAEEKAVDALAARYAVERGYLTQEALRGLALHLILKQCRGTRLKEQGSLYLVPAPDDERIEPVTAAFAAAGFGLRTLPLFEENVAQMRDDARRGLLAEVEELRADVASRLERVYDGQKARAATLADRLEEAEALRAKAQLFREVFAVDLAEIEAALSDTRLLVAQTESALVAAAQRAA